MRRLANSKLHLPRATHPFRPPVVRQISKFPMPRLPITGDYPPDWPAIGDRVRAEAGNRCIRCRHPYKVGEHGKGEWTPCDEQCTHGGPLAFLDPDGKAHRHELGALHAGALVAECESHGSDGPYAEWRILTVHHLDGNKANCDWANCLSLCQRCHLQIQSRVNPETPYFLEHSDWFKPYAAAFYARKYLGETLTREQVMARLDELLALERLA